VTVNPAQVTVNPPNVQIVQPTEKRHAHLQYINPSQFQPIPPTFPLREGQPATVNRAFINVGDSPALDCQHAGAVYVVRTATEQSEMFQKFIKDNQMKPCRDVLPNSAGNYDATFDTYGTPVLSKSDILEIQNQRAGICGVGRVSWRDDTGHY
jgi:hypothetical protein